MWKCQKCETLNDGEFCVVCGTRQPAQIQSSPNVQIERQAEEIYHVKKMDDRKDSSKKFPMGVIVALLAVIIAMAAVIIALISYRGTTPSKEVDVVTPQPVSTGENESVKNGDEEQIKAEPEKTVEPEIVYESENPADENVIQRIRDRYNWIHSISSQCEVLKNNLGVKYYYYNNKLVRVDVPADHTFNYSRCYYYDDNEELNFAFVFIDRIENRFYFDNGRLIRWRDTQKKNHDNKYNDVQYREWEEKILLDAENHSI